MTVILCQCRKRTKVGQERLIEKVKEMYLTKVQMKKYLDNLRIATSVITIRKNLKGGGIYLSYDKCPKLVSFFMIKKSLPMMFSNME